MGVKVTLTSFPMIVLVGILSVSFIGFSQILVTDTLTVLRDTICALFPSTENLQLSPFLSKFTTQIFIFKTYTSSISHYYH